MADNNVHKFDSTELRRRVEESLGEETVKEQPLGTENDPLKLLHELQVHQIELEMQNAELCQARDKLEAALVQYTDLYDFAPVGYFTLDREGTISRVNSTAAGLVGLERSQLVGRRLGLLVVDEARPAFADFLGRAFASLAKETCEVALHKEGNLPLFVKIEAVVAASGQECRIALIDITESTLVSKLKREAEEIAKTTIGKSAEIALQTIEDAAEEALEKALGITELPLNNEKANIEEARLKVDEAAKAALLKVKKAEEEARLKVVKAANTLQLDNETKEVTIQKVLKAAEIAHLKVDKALKMARRTVVAAVALQESERKFKLVADTTPLAIYLSVGIEQKAEYINPTFVRLFGYTLEDVPTVEHWWPLAYPDDTYHRQVIAEWQRRVKLAIETRSEIEPMETVVICKDGSRKNIQWGFKSIGEQNWAFGLDLTERKRAEEEKLAIEQHLLHTQKLESLGVLAGGIAHDFNNILATIIGYCGLTKMNYKNAENNILQIEKAAERAAVLCRQMLEYAGKAQLYKTQVNMLMLVEEMVTMLKLTLPQNAVIKPDLSDDIPFINGDAIQIRQIVMNLIINSSEAIGNERGEIRVSLSRETEIAGQSDKDYHGKAIPPGEYACLEVTDNGCGMSEETKNRIFEPFYTTKFIGRGLGMSAVLGIIMSHCGALQLFSQLGQGTTFKVYLPVQISESAEEENQSLSVPSVPWLGSGTILLVEDEDQVRLIAKTLLQKFGFTVLEAVNGKEALELYQKNAADITLVVTDMGMPIMDGYELFRELKQLKPELPIIVSSGFGDAGVSSRIAIDDIAGLISKPYNPSQLQDVLKSVVEHVHPTHP